MIVYELRRRSSQLANVMTRQAEALVLIPKLVSHLCEANSWCRNRTGGLVKPHLAELC